MRVTLPARWLRFSLALLVALGVCACGSGGRHASSSFSAPQAPPRPPAPAPATGYWLGLAYNSSARVGVVEEFSSHGIVYDRSGSLEVLAGQTPASDRRLRHGLQVSIAAGMIPDIEIDPSVGPLGCAGDPNGTTQCLPVQESDIGEYVRGFASTATSIRRLYPHRAIVFEPMNEPWSWGYPPGAPAAKDTAYEYAAILRRLLPAVQGAGVPLQSIYVPAEGKLEDGSEWVTDLYQAQPCLQSSCGPIEGWNLHPYGRPGSRQEGIDSVPGVRAQMRSGMNNVIVSEIGFCSREIDGGRGCGENTSTVVGSAVQTEHWMAQTLGEALAMHQAGWLKALLVWDRAGDGWAMQEPDGSLTRQGQVLERFAQAHSGPPAYRASGPG